SQSGGTCRHSGFAVACVRSPGSPPAPYTRDDPKDHCQLEDPGRSPCAAVSDRRYGSLRKGMMDQLTSAGWYPYRTDTCAFYDLSCGFIGENGGGPGVRLRKLVGGKSGK